MQAAFWCRRGPREELAWVAAFETIAAEVASTASQMEDDASATSAGCRGRETAARGGPTAQSEDDGVLNRVGVKLNSSKFPRQQSEFRS